MDTILTAMNQVSTAIQRKKVAEEGETKVKTLAFDLRLKRLHKRSFNNSAYTIKSGPDTLVSLPNPEAVVQHLGDHVPIDVQVNVNN